MKLMQLMPMKLTQWLDYIASIHVKRIDMGLDRMQYVMNKLLSVRKPSNKQPFVITVGGTNGKGSLVYALSQLLLDYGLQVATYTSPHLYRFNERILINGNMVSDESLCEAFSAIEALRGNVILSFFEFTTLAAFWLFMRNPLQVWVLEVGLGGRLDAVNVVDPDIAVITSVDIEHSEWLGDNVADIAMEKSGIARTGKPVVIFENFPDKALTYLTQIGAKLHYPQSGSIAEEAIEEKRLSLQTLAKLVTVKRLLPWQIDDQRLISSMQKLQIPARKQYIEVYHRTWLLDTAHNPAASQWLKNYVQRYFPHQTIYPVFTCLADKDIHQMIDIWSDIADHWYLVNLENHHRAIPKAELLAIFHQKKLSFSLTAYSMLDRHWRKFLHLLPQDGLLVVFGSFVHLGLIWHKLSEQENRVEEKLKSKILKAI